MQLRGENIPHSPNQINVEKQFSLVSGRQLSVRNGELVGGREMFARNEREAESVAQVEDDEEDPDASISQAAPAHVLEVLGVIAVEVATRFGVVVKLAAIDDDFDGPLRNVKGS